MDRVMPSTSRAISLPSMRNSIACSPICRKPGCSEMPANDQLANRLMRRLCAFSSFRPEKNPDMAQAYEVAISRLLREFGSERTYDAITAVIDAGSPFPPSAGDLRMFIRFDTEPQMSGLEVENARLRELLTYYGEHTGLCEMPVGKPPCTCGFSKVLAALLGEDEAREIEAFGQVLIESNKGNKPEKARVL